MWVKRNVLKLVKAGQGGEAERSSSGLDFSARQDESLAERKRKLLAQAAGSSPTKIEVERWVYYIIYIFFFSNGF